MKRWAVIAALALVLVSGASATESTIYPGVGIGMVKLGMTLRQVKKALGSPQLVDTRAQLSGRRGYAEYGWNFSTLWVGFVNTRGRLHAVLIGTDLRAQRTTDGVGVGTTLETLRHRYRVTCNVGPNADARFVGQPLFEPAMRIAGWCVLGPSATPTTIFRMGCPSRGPSCGRFHVVVVIVRKSSF